MGTEISSIKMQLNNGDVKQYECLNANKDDAVFKIVKDENGNEKKYTLREIKQGDKTEYKYILFDSGKKLEKSGRKLSSQLPLFFSTGETKYDRFIDGIFDCFVDDKPVGKDDGVIGFWQGCKYFLKGCLSPIKAMVKHPIKTALATAVTIGAISLFPVLGPALLIAGAGIGFGTLVCGACKCWAAQTDGEAKAACENMGSGFITTLLSLIGIRKMNSALRARNELGYNMTHAGETRLATPPAPEAPEYGGLYGKIQKVAKYIDKGVRVVKRCAKGLDDGYHGAKDFIPTCKNMKQFNPPNLKTASVSTPQKHYDGLRALAKDVNTQFWTGRKLNGTGFTDIQSEYGGVLGHIRDGHHFQAKEGLHFMKNVLNQKGHVTDATQIERAKGMIAECENLLKATSHVNNGISPNFLKATTGVGYGENITDHKMSENAGLYKNTFSFAS